MAKTPFEKLFALSKKTTLLSAAAALLEWDQETYMPAEGAIPRSDQLEVLAELIHKSATSPTFKKYLSELIDLETGEMKTEEPLHIQAAAREWRRDLLLAEKLPTPFVKKFSRTSSASIHAWMDAKEKSDFSLFAPHLEKIVSLCQKKSSLLGYEKHPYDALLDQYEPGMTVEILTPLFKRLKGALVEILAKAPKTPPLSLGTFPRKGQEEMGEILLKAMGFSPKASRLDNSFHPFCSGIHPDDTRMTTRIDEKHPMYSISSITHEGGHGLYNRNLPKEHYGTPVCNHASYGVDESQSRLFETMIGQGLPFWEHFYPKLQEIFKDNLAETSLESFYSHINRVEPSMIRVEADEVTYCLHVILRFEIEMGLMDGSIKVKQVPALWNQKMKESLGITPKDDGEGCLQDIHWAMGGIGYFPTYILGNLLAAELFKGIKESHSDWKEKIASGNLSFLEEWLKEKIHCHGHLYTPEDLILKAIGKPLEIEAYIEYLQEKFNSK
jgi:carboxypeptidase Taq